jgi:hypothetical protein
MDPERWVTPERRRVVPQLAKQSSQLGPSMTNKWSHPHGKTSSEVGPFHLAGDNGVKAGSHMNCCDLDDTAYRLAAHGDSPRAGAPRHASLRGVPDADPVDGF